MQFEQLVRTSVALLRTWLGFSSGLSSALRSLFLEVVAAVLESVLCFHEEVSNIRLF